MKFYLFMLFNIFDMGSLPDPMLNGEKTQNLKGMEDKITFQGIDSTVFWMTAFSLKEMNK